MNDTPGRTPEFDDTYDDAEVHPAYEAFSRKAENHATAVPLNFMYYNFVQIHRTLGTTRAMGAEVTTELCDGDIVALLEDVP